MALVWLSVQLIPKNIEHSVLVEIMLNNVSVDGIVLAIFTTPALALDLT